MILIEGIPVLAARLAAEQKAKEWLAKTRRSVSDTTQRTSVDWPLATIKPSAKAA
jgi:ABC-type Fe3+-hydroxamate transport system substrate-binding protein